MGLLTSKVKSIDTSRQQAETGRQRGITDQRAYEDLELADLFDTELYDTNRGVAEDQFGRLTDQLRTQDQARRGRIADERSRTDARLTDELAARRARIGRQTEELYGQIDDEADRTGRFNRRTLNNARRVADAVSRNESDDNASDDYFDMQDQNLADRRALGAREGADRRGGRLSDMLGAVDQEFGGFDDSYFDGVAKQYVDARKPRIEQNYKDRTRRSTFDLARKGNFESSASARVFSRLAQAKADEEAAVAAEGANRANALRSQIEQQRSRAIDNAYSAIDSAPDDILDEGMRGEDVDPRFAMKTQRDIDGGSQDRGVGYPRFGAVAGGGGGRGGREIDDMRPAVMPDTMGAAVDPINRNQGGDARSRVMPDTMGAAVDPINRNQGGDARSRVMPDTMGAAVDPINRNQGSAPRMSLGRPGGGFGAQGGAGRSYSTGVMGVPPNARTGGSTPAKQPVAPSFRPLQTPQDEDAAFAQMRERASASAMPSLRVM